AAGRGGDGLRAGAASGTPTGRAARGGAVAIVHGLLVSGGGRGRSPAGAWPRRRPTTGGRIGGGVTNRPGAGVRPGPTYGAYVERGDSENRNKEIKCWAGGGPAERPARGCGRLRIARGEGEAAAPRAWGKGGGVLGGGRTARNGPVRTRPSAHVARAGRL